MIDIFADIKPKPKLFIADIKMLVTYKVRNKPESMILSLEKMPIVLSNGKLPTKITEERFFKNIYDNYVKKGKFESTTIKIESMENVKFSSNLAYSFDYDRH